MYKLKRSFKVFFPSLFVAYKYNIINNKIHFHLERVTFWFSWIKLLHGHAMINNVRNEINSFFLFCPWRIQFKKKLKHVLSFLLICGCSKRYTCQRKCSSWRLVVMLMFFYWIIVCLILINMYFMYVQLIATIKVLQFLETVHFYYSKQWSIWTN